MILLQVRLLLEKAVELVASCEDSPDGFEPMKTIAAVSEHRKDPCELELKTVDESSSAFLGLDVLEPTTTDASLSPFLGLFLLLPMIIFLLA